MIPSPPKSLSVASKVATSDPRGWVSEMETSTLKRKKIINGWNFQIMDPVFCPLLRGSPLLESVYYTKIVLC